MHPDPHSWPRDHASAAHRIAAHLPAGSRARLTPSGEGDFCLAFWQHTRVVRVARHAEAAAALEREACVLPEIAHLLPLPVPRPTFYRAGEGCAFSVHRRVPGAALTRARWERLAPPLRDGAAAELGRFIDALHSLPVAGARGCGVPVLERSAFATPLRARVGRLAGWLPAEALARLSAALTLWSTAPPDAAPVLLHRDIAPGHVLFDAGSGRLTGIIDFGDLAIGDPARDFIYLYEDFGSALLAAVLRHYRREAAATLLPRIRIWYLLELVAWTVERVAGGDAAESREGASGIVAELEWLGL